MDQVQRTTGNANEQSISARQADCYAGMGPLGLDHPGPASAVESITEEDIREAITAAEAIGDDRIQEQATGTVNKESTHGSSDQRVKWFSTGFKQGTRESCDTFSVANP